MDEKELVKSSNNICEKCNRICYAKHFQQNFENWTSGNDDIDKLIQDTQISAHGDVRNALEWIPYDKFYDIKYFAGDKYRAKWINGYMIDWDNNYQNWIRKNQKIIVELKELNNLKNITSKFINWIISNAFGITQNPETKNYMIVLSIICEKCNCICYAKHFQQNFENWTSDKALEWIPYDKFYNINYIAKDKYKANWIDGYITYWNDNISGNKNWKRKNHNWERENQNMTVELKKLDNKKNTTLEFTMDEFRKAYGITQNPESKDYMMVLDVEKCKKCNLVCYASYFQQSFHNWTSGNNNIDKFIQNMQLLAHDNVSKALEWIPYDKFYSIEYIAEGEYKTNWIDGYMINWSNKDQSWKRKDQNMIVKLKVLDSPNNIVLKLTDNIIIKVYGIIEIPETKDYMLVLDNKCIKCNNTCNAIHFEYFFGYWTSEGEYKANWIDGYMINWSNKNQSWKRIDQNMIVKLKILNNPKNIILEFTDNSITKVYGITQVPETQDYMLVLDYKCLKCNNTCYAIYFEYFFGYWTSGGFGKVYRANWIDGNMSHWDDNDDNWKRAGQDMFIALKSLKDSKNVTLEFMNEIASHNKVDDSYFIIKFYGITQDPETKNYMMVLEYAENGSLRNYLNTSYNELNLTNKINYLFNIASGLENIHEKEIIHRDLHIGNVLKNNDVILITDMGLCKPINHKSSENTRNNIYGILPYIAPDILRGQSYTKEADIYSFGIIMCEVISGLPPYHDLSHDNNLAMKICQGLRPRFNIKVPQSIVHLVKRCLDANLLNRPTAIEIRDKLQELQIEVLVKIQKEINEKPDDNFSINNRVPLASLSYKTHPEAIYTSRLLNFNKLPEPKNSDDYYEQNEDIISQKFSGIN
ncbi:kinase-like domain-containing protein [Rhizophagus clarus]|uniref:Kinase-like domain-containing protein n=1 Tax=Rhizophagus clarus TaxID=94130 RepID=A0A8H3QGE2_9GLOM|nr:kinase-like domain-containing protein [Rhizophagus clarus]